MCTRISAMILSGRDIMSAKELYESLGFDVDTEPPGWIARPSDDRKAVFAAHVSEFRPQGRRLGG